MMSRLAGLADVTSKFAAADRKSQQSHSV